MISEEIVEASWREIGELDEETGRAHMEKLAREQEELLVFVTTMTEQLSPQAQETAIYAFVVLCRMFERGAGKRLPKAKHQKVAAAYESILDDLERLLPADERFLERHALVSTASEPFVMRYVTEVLFEPDDPDERPDDDEIAELFICLKTVVDVLHELTG